MAPNERELRIPYAGKQVFALVKEGDDVEAGQVVLQIFVGNDEFVDIRMPEAGRVWKIFNATGSMKMGGALAMIYGPIGQDARPATLSLCEALACLRPWAVKVGDWLFCSPHAHRMEQALASGIPTPSRAVIPAAKHIAVPDLGALPTIQRTKTSPVASCRRCKSADVAVINGRWELAAGVLGFALFGPLGMAAAHDASIRLFCKVCGHEWTPS